MSYTVGFGAKVRKALDTLTDEDYARVSHAINRLAENPRPRGCLKLKGYANQWRVRSGRYRIIYSILDAQLVVEVLDVDDRKDVYRR
jgi:mRNA interferase RelE/StbE